MAPPDRSSIGAPPLASWNAARDLWETTQQASLLSELSDVYSATWPASGSMRNGSAYPRPEWEPPTAGSASSSSAPTTGAGNGLLPTPRTSDTNGPGLTRDGGARPPDGDQDPVALLPTPQASLADHNRANGVDPEVRRGQGRQVSLADVARHELLPTPRATRGGSSTETVALLPTPRATDGDKGGPTEQAWGPYAAAIARWEAINGPAPNPTTRGKKGNPKLNPAFALWMMGVPAGWVTDVPDITDNEALRLAGNGVCPPQAVAALRLCAARLAVAESLGGAA